MGVVFLFFLIIYILFAIGIYHLVKKVNKNKIVLRMVIVIFILIPTYDIIITNILGTFYCLTTPSSYINEKIEYPKSIYWEDNIYPGFDKEDRKLMIKNYLDGVHLKTMVLNGDDGKIYLYTANPTIWDNLKPLKKEDGQVYYDKVDEIVEEIIKTSQQIYTKDNVPKTNYTVSFNEIKLDFFSSKFLYSDETKVVDNMTNKVIAYNRRIMRFFYNIFPDIVIGGWYYSQKQVCGEKYFYFERDIFAYFGYYGSAKHIENINKKLYNKYIKGEK